MAIEDALFDKRAQVKTSFFVFCFLMYVFRLKVHDQDH